MKFLFFIAIAFSCTAVTAQQSVAKIKITDLEKTIAESKTPLVVNFWATFCIPCIEELPYFLEAAETYKKDSLTLLLVSLDLDDEYPAGIQKFMTKHKIKVRVAWLDETNADYFLPKIDKKWEGAIPATLFINNATKYRSFSGDQLSKKQLITTIEKMLKK